MRTRTTIACLCAAALVGITALANADLIAPKRPVLQQVKSQEPPPKTTQPDATKPASEGLGMPLDGRCRAVKDACLAKCCTELPTKDCGFKYWNCVNSCLEKNGCLGASNDQGH